MSKFNYLLVCISILLCLSSCEEDPSFNHEPSVDDNSLYKMSGKLEFESSEIVRNSVLEMTEIFKLIVEKDNQARKEIFEILKSDFYIEPYVGLSELLEPQKAEIYKFIEVNKSLKGSFKKAFELELNKNSIKYPNLKEISERRVDLDSQIKTSGANFHDYASLAFYIPYMVDENNVEFESDDNITVVPAVVDSNSGLGYSRGDNDSWDAVMVDDSYAENNLTLIIEPNAYRAPDDGDCGDGIIKMLSAPVSKKYSNLIMISKCPDITPPNDGDDDTPTGNQYTGDCSALEPQTSGGYIRQVFIGHAKLTKQYDRLISFTGNGGGSEIRIGRLDSRDQIDIDSTGNISANQWDNYVSVDISRRNIRKRNFVWVGSIWHENWECFGDIHEVLFGVYEEDTEGEIIFDETISWQGDELFNIDITIPNRSKDEIIRKWVREKTEFFATNLLDQGGGLLSGMYSFSDREWGIYDVGANFSYTMPHRWVEVGNNTNY